MQNETPQASDSWVFASSVQYFLHFTGKQRKRKNVYWFPRAAEPSVTDGVV